MVMVCEALVLNAPLLTCSVTVNVPVAVYWCVGLTLVEEFPSPKFHDTVVKPVELLVKVTLRSHAVWLVKLAESCAKEPPTAEPQTMRLSRVFLRTVGIGKCTTQDTEKLLQEEGDLFLSGGLSQLREKIKHKIRLVCCRHYHSEDFSGQRHFRL